MRSASAAGEFRSQDLNSISQSLSNNKQDDANNNVKEESGKKLHKRSNSKVGFTSLAKTAKDLTRQNTIEENKSNPLRKRDSDTSRRGGVFFNRTKTLSELMDQEQEQKRKVHIQKNKNEQNEQQKMFCNKNLMRIVF